MKFATMAAVSLVMMSGAAFAQTSSNCTVVDLKPGEAAPSGSTSMSTSITAGNGQVTGTTTTGGHTVTTTSGGGSGSSSFATSSSSDGSSTTVTDSTGRCTIYRKAEDKK